MALSGSIQSSISSIPPLLEVRIIDSTRPEDINDRSSSVVYNNRCYKGDGATSVVYEGTYQGKPVAIKEFFTNETFLHEKAIVSDFNSPYIVKFFAYCLTPPCLVSELMGCTLKRALSSPALTEWRVCLGIAYDVAAALHYLHNKQLVYGDIKPENVLLDATLSQLADVSLKKDIRTKLIDFGYTYPESEKIKRGTVDYMAPEVFKVAPSRESDVYSFGILLLELVLKTAFNVPEALYSAFVSMIENNWYSEPGLRKKQTFIVEQLNTTKCPHEIQKLITDCTSWEPAKRPSTSQIMMRLTETPGAKLKLVPSQPETTPASAPPTANPAAVKDPAPVPPSSNIVSSLQQLRM